MLHMCQVNAELGPLQMHANAANFYCRDLQGARRLYVIFLRPFLHTHKPQIDTGISTVSTLLVKHSTFLRSIS